MFQPGISLDYNAFMYIVFVYKYFYNTHTHLIMSIYKTN